MAQRKKSILNILGWGLLVDVLLFVTALAVFALFASSSFSTAYVIAFAILLLLASVLYYFKRTTRKNS